MSDPRVSILIPAYNRADYLAETVSSALSQSFRDLQVVVVDDGSTDATPEVVKKFTDSRLRYIRQPNQGVSTALNTAWRAGESEFVAMLGSDDVMLSHQIETLLGIAEQDATLGVVYARAQGMDSNGVPLPQLYGGPMHYPNALASVLYENSVCTIAALIRRNLVAQVGGFNPKLFANEDWDLWIRLAERTRFYYCNEILGRYRLHSSSLTGSRSAQYENVITGRVQLIEHYFVRPDIPPEALAIESVAKRNVYMDAMIRYLTIRNLRMASGYSVKALKSGCNPLSTAFRLISVAFFDFYLSKRPWGVRFMDALVAQRHKAA